MSEASAQGTAPSPEKRNDIYEAMPVDELLALVSAHAKLSRHVTLLQSLPRDQAAEVARKLLRSMNKEEMEGEKIRDADQKGTAARRKIEENKKRAAASLQAAIAALGQKEIAPVKPNAPEKTDSSLSDSSWHGAKS